MILHPGEITIGKYFGDWPLKYNRDSSCPFLERHGFDLLTNNVLNRYAAPARRYQHWPQLLECCKFLIAERASQPFAGNVTLARIMADAGIMLRDRYKLPTPAPWWEVVRRLRDMRHTRVSI